ncbi:hypothetical protein F8154_12230 [Alkaliphilus pronyensis]|uniref:Uncharacterized protein n=1 Tax=Alkaliphilus pronyensis TaxID=1482732 RepID=A0A6I0EWP0_9FIRM|nr:hypothetical protein [Alkaliphilus pronyensis]KAB3532134.1 hypothetical protein F8154_12230 [Alkaliphilus pronyensis]
MIDYEEYRFAGFVEGGQNLGVSIFRKDKNNNYRKQSIEKRYSDIATFYVPIIKEGIKILMV